MPALETNPEGEKTQLMPKQREEMSPDLLVSKIVNPDFLLA